MALFGRKKDNIEKPAAAEKPQGGGFAIKVLGSGCSKCNQLEANTILALKELGMDSAVEHVRDFAEIAAYGVMSTPALVIGSKAVSAGRVLKPSEIAELIRENQ
ncbi:thioredoxin family protein [Clostridiaceae bacterium OttesenSCG-928-D20]|nr:thioredoxin family protein [Clostridiaceae bacterium OttesenSCG-928-D20]